MRQVLRGWGRGRDCREARGEGMIQGHSLLQAEGAGEGSPPPHHPHHLIQERRRQGFDTWKLAILKKHPQQTYISFIIFKLWRIKIQISLPSLLTLHIVIILAHVCVLSKQCGAGGGGDASTDPLHTHLFLKALNPTGTLQTDVNQLAKYLQCNQERKQGLTDYHTITLFL